MIDMYTNGVWHGFCTVRLLAKSSFIFSLVVQLYSAKDQVLIKRLLSNRLSCHRSLQWRTESQMYVLLCYSKTFFQLPLWSFSLKLYKPWNHRKESLHSCCQFVDYSCQELLCVGTLNTLFFKYSTYLLNTRVWIFFAITHFYVAA